MVLSIDYEGYNKWFLEFRPSIPGRLYSSFSNIIHLYGRISINEILDSDKFTIVVNDEKDFDMIKRRPPVSLRANLYVMLIDLEWGKIVKEEILCRYRKD
ncbi:hypothetical protein AAV98_05450 [Bacillus sp. CHD6a]|nr:hypothetical protein AAV98_05450 [Bacillus sp. CHD6a]